MKIKQHLNIVLDTNVLLVSISEYSKYHWLYQYLIEKKYHIFITNEILTEYEEIIGKKLSVNTANAVIRTLMELDNVHPVSIYFKLNLIIQDPDDNKFADCAFASNCDFLVTNDNHFNILQSVEFPQINLIKIEEFKSLIEQHFDKQK